MGVLLPTSDSKLVEQGQELLAIGYPEDAAHFFRLALAADETDAAAHFGLGAAAEQLQCFDSAKVHYGDAAKLSPDCAGVWNRLGYVLYQIDDYSGSSAALAKALDLKSDYPLALNNQALQLNVEHRITEARQTLEKAEKVAPRMSFIQSGFSLLEDNACGPERAQAAIERAPRQAGNWYQLAHARLLQGDEDGASEAAHSALTLAKDVCTYHVLALLFMSLDDDEGVSLALTIADRTKPESLQDYQAMAHVKLMLNETTESIKIADEGMRRYQRTPELLALSFLARHQLGKVDGAIAFFEEHSETLLKTEFWFTEVLETLARSGQAEVARGILQKSCEEGRFSREESQAIETEIFKSDDGYGFPDGELN